MEIIKRAIISMREDHLRTLFHITNKAAQVEMINKYQEYEKAVFEAMCAENHIFDSAYENLKEELY